MRSIASEHEDFSSPFLKGHIRICNGTDWPRDMDMFMMPLLAANREKFKGKTVLDIGTSSGMLALYAAQLGAAKVVATDIEPRAISCARENARRLGLDSVIETRLVSPENPSAFSVIRPEEIFDIILSAPRGWVNRIPFVVSGSIDEGITPNDTIKRGLSIIKGLQKHLSPDGAALLHYNYAVTHDIMVGYAQHLGYVVGHHPALLIVDSDWCALYNHFAAQVARTENIDPDALLLPRSKDSGCGAGTEPYNKVTWDREGVAFPRLWGRDLDRASPGMIVIRKQGSESSQALPKGAPGQDGEGAP